MRETALRLEIQVLTLFAYSGGFHLFECVSAFMISFAQLLFKGSWVRWYQDLKVVAIFFLSIGQCSSIFKALIC